MSAETYVVDGQEVAKDCPSTIEKIEALLSGINGSLTSKEKRDIFAVKLLPLLAVLSPTSLDIVAPQIKGRLGISRSALLEEVRGLGKLSELAESSIEGGKNEFPKSRPQPQKPEEETKEEAQEEVVVPIPTYQEVEAKFREYFHLRDTTSLKVLFATVAVNRAEGDPLWLLIVGPPSSLKTELIRSLSGVPGILPLSSITPKTFASGDPKDKKASLLLRLPPNCILTLKDFGSVLTMYREARQELMGQLREIYDGEFSKEFGNGIRISWNGKIGIIAGVTDIIETYHSVHQVLGERFILLRTEVEDRNEVGMRALQTKGFERAIRHDIKKTVIAFFQAPHLQKPKTPLFIDWEIRLVALADFITRARTGILRDGYTRDIEHVPDIEGPGRLAKQFASLLMGLAVIQGRENPKEEDYAIVYKVGIDSLPRVRAKVLTALNQEEGQAPSSLSERLDLPEGFAKRVLEELRVLGVIRSLGGAYFLSETTKGLLETSSPNLDVTSGK